MPYIKQELRDLLDDNIDALVCKIESAESQHPGSMDGVLNYVVSRLCTSSIDAPGTWAYADLARFIGALGCAKLEAYRRIGGPKEDVAIKTNGDIQEYEKFTRRLK